jgi:hypothetical protein
MNIAWPEFWSRDGSSEAPRRPALVVGDMHTHTSLGHEVTRTAVSYTNLLLAGQGGLHTTQSLEIAIAMYEARAIQLSGCATTLPLSGPCLIPASSLLQIHDVARFTDAPPDVLPSPADLNLGSKTSIR